MSVRSETKRPAWTQAEAQLGRGTALLMAILIALLFVILELLPRIAGT